jgi:fatty acid-binding protein DegV
VDTPDNLHHNGLLGEAQAVQGAMLNIKPFLTIEEGHLTTMEKVRTRSQAVDKLVEFVTEFDEIERLVIVQNSPFMTEAVRLLQDRLAAELSQRNFPMKLYGPMLASYLGPDATGVIVLEKEYE